MPRRPTLPWRARLVFFLLCLLVVVSWSVILVTDAGSNRILLTEGEASPRDILAPQKVIYLSDVLTERERQRRIAEVEKVYTAADPEVFRKQLSKAQQTLAAIEELRADTSSSIEERVESVEALPELILPTQAISNALSLSTADWQQVKTETLRVLGILMQEDVRDDNLAESRRRIPRLTSTALSDDQRDLVISLVGNFLVPNSFYDPQMTAQRQREAREEVEPIQRTIEKGEAILRAGDIVTDLDIEELAALGLLQQDVQWEDYLGAMLLALTIVAALSAYIYYFQLECCSRPRRALLLALTLVGTVGAAKLMVPGHALLPYLFPMTAVSMLLSILLDTELAIVTTTALSIIIGQMAGGSLEITAYTLLGGVVAALSVHRMEQLGAFVRAALFTGLANLATVLAFRFLSHDYYNTAALLQIGGMSIANGALSSSLTFAAFSLLGRVFGITTTLQLLELARPTHPLFRQLLLNAPGTYHHTLIISNMAERAAAAVGADSLLARVGSYYHDIGKILRPYFFVENQTDSENVHEKLDPVTSAQIIISHVSDGLVLARRYGLPDKIRAFIPEHHGTMLASYFYRMAVKNAEAGAGVDESDFRYAGPKPQSKESAIVMLADSTEARVRAERPPTPEEMNRLIRQIINDRLSEGQLDECDLTLRDLEVIRAAFLRVLQGIVHPRIQYPEASVQERLRRRDQQTAKP